MKLIKIKSKAFSRYEDDQKLLFDDESKQYPGKDFKNPSVGSYFVDKHDVDPPFNRKVN